ncbi:hypothetical protein JTB14_018020 [Gonioctena quinquepunctata]|nr:hypothetical protein JTB14_018020 [Gonioctena quinquepunctata]
MPLSLHSSFGRELSMACQRKIDYTLIKMKYKADMLQTFSHYRHLVKVLQRYITTSAMQCNTDIEDRTMDIHKKPRPSTELDSVISIIPEIPNCRYNEIHHDSTSSRDVLKFFPSPKNTLHSIFNLVAQETKNKSLNLSPSFRSVKEGKKPSVWICTYNIGWPKDVKFSARDTKKKLASDKAALAALSWLLKEKKITEQGAPIIYDEQDVKKISKNTCPITIDNWTVERMKRIVDVYQNEIEPYIQNGELIKYSDVEDNDFDTNTKENNILGTFKNQKFLGLGKYLVNEELKLPISEYKEHIIQLLQSNQVLIIKGEPGCGKSTRVPQYVLEAWAKGDGLLGKPGKIAVTQPRRIAAISLSQRVAAEREESVGHIVGYQVRLNSQYRQETGRILYCTTGILLRHLQSDANLSTYTHVILDEAHERDVNTDLLINLLRSAIKSNSNLKLIVMSATIDTDMFSKYFAGAPVLEIPGFTYPVKQHFLDNSQHFDAHKTMKMCEGEVPSVIPEDVAQVLQYIHRNKPEGAILCFLPGWEEITKIQRLIPRQSDVAVYCLHSRLQDSDQWKIFSRPPPGVRKIILTTNIAETSVTVDDVVYVVDTGIHKEQRFDVPKGIKCIDNHWISKSSVTQRKGRAGRVQPGECFHLYPLSKYKSFSEYSLPEIMRVSLTKIVLDSKVLSNNMNALEFMQKLPTSPKETAIVGAVEELKELELLDKAENLTGLGRTLAEFQLEPELGKAMVNAVIFKCVSPIVDIITLFSSETELFVSGLLDKEEARRIKRQFSEDSDHLAMMRLFERFLDIGQNGDSYELRQFCDGVSLVSHKMRTLEKLRKIHFDYLYNGLQRVVPISDEYSDNDELVKAVLFSGVGNILTHRNWEIVKRRLKSNTSVLVTRNNHKATITPESVNFKRKQYPSRHLLYINETRSNIRRTTVVRESSLMSDISVLLFSNGDLRIKEIDENAIDSEPQVELVLEGTNINFLCDRELAEEIVKCKGALSSSYRYFIRLLTDAGESNDKIIESWNRILILLNEILNRNSVSAEKKRSSQ